MTTLTVVTNPLPAAAPVSPTLTIFTATISNALRDRTVLWLAVMFMGMVLLSAYLGWSATSTINQIYAKAAIALAADGRDVPPNPVNETSPLAMIRNMTTYVSLLGALVAIVLGHQMVVEDRRSGVLPLIASRPNTRLSYALGKLLALVATLFGLLVIAALTNAATMALLPGLPPTSADWLGFIGFYAISALFLVLFGLTAMATASFIRSETLGLLIPVTLWLALTFVLPQIASNINPMAALNPVKAMVAPPDGRFFSIAGPLLAPISFTSSYRDLSATILGFAPADQASLGTLGGIASLLIGSIVAGFCALTGLTRLDPTRSDTDE